MVRGSARLCCAYATCGIIKAYLSKIIDELSSWCGSIANFLHSKTQAHGQTSRPLDATIALTSETSRNTIAEAKRPICMRLSGGMLRSGGHSSQICFFDAQLGFHARGWALKQQAGQFFRILALQVSQTYPDIHAVRVGHVSIWWSADP